MWQALGIIGGPALKPIMQRFAVNLGGCFIIAASMHAALTLGWSPTTRAAVTIGFIGGLTTYSSFNYETMRLVEEGAPLTAAVNVALTVPGGCA